MGKKKIDELQAQRRELESQMREAYTTGDEKMFADLDRKLTLARNDLNGAIQDEQIAALAKPVKKDKNAQLREILKNAKNGGSKDFVMQRREITSGILGEGKLNNMESAGFPVTVMELLEPLEVETVYDKVGLRVQTGVVSGQLQWPCLDTLAEVKIMGEAVKVEDTDLDFSKIVPVAKRMAISIKVTNEALENASFDLYGTVVNQMSRSLKRVLNAAVTSSTAISEFEGPFAGGDDTKLNKITFAAAMPTFKELLQMKGVVAGTGASINGFCYLMNTFTYATLEATSKTESNGGMIIENGRLGGYPVFVTDSAKIADGCVNAGSFVYAALLQHGDVHFIVDPYSLADTNEIKLTLNSNWSLTTLKYQGFCVGTATNA